MALDTNTEQRPTPESDFVDSSGKAPDFAHKLPVDREHDTENGAVLGILGGVLVGAAAGGPFGAMVGAIVGGVASGYGVAAVDHLEREAEQAHGHAGARPRGDEVLFPSSFDNGYVPEVTATPGAPSTEVYFAAQTTSVAPLTTQPSTVFVLNGYDHADSVLIAGTFNEWSQSRDRLTRDRDQWTASLYLGPGKHAYKYVVDGTWMLDPANHDTVTDADGHINSVRVVRAVNTA